MMPSQAVVFDNDAGSAPVFALEKDGKIIDLHAGTATGNDENVSAPGESHI
jgi:hypothetical protein